MNFIVATLVALISLVSLTEASAQVWPNEPSGMNVVADCAMDVAPCPGSQWDPGSNPGTVVVDATAPFSPSNVLRFRYNPSSIPGVGSGGEPRLNFSATDEIWMGFLVKIDANFTGYSSGNNKMVRIIFGNDSSWWLEINGQQPGPFQPGMVLSPGPGQVLHNCHLPGISACDDGSSATIWFGPAFSGAFVKNQWHRVEIYVNRATNTLRYWFNGSLLYQVTNMDMPDSPIIGVGITQAWDGSDNPSPCPSCPTGFRTNADTWWWDHIRVKTGSAGTFPTDQDGDGVPDSSDNCPSVPGPPSNNGCPVADTTPPSKVSPVTVQVLNSTSLNVVWDAPNPNGGTIHHYEVWRCTPDPCTPTLYQNNVTVQFINETGLTPNTSYVYIVRAYDDALLQGSFSDQAKDTTLINTSISEDTFEDNTLASAPVWLLTAPVFTPPTNPTVGWDNLPNNYQIISDWPWDTMTGGCWRNDGGGQIVQDPSAPLTPNNVMRARRLDYAMGGSNSYCTFSGETDIYIGFWWKPSNPFTGWPQGQNKIAIFRSVTGGHFYLLMNGPQGGPFTLGGQLDYPGIFNNQTNGCPDCGDIPGAWNIFANSGDASISPGSWHKIEMLFRRGTDPTSANGSLQIWKNGVRIMNYTNVNYPSSFLEFGPNQFWDSGIDLIPFDPTPGVDDPGTGGEESNFYDHVIVAKPGVIIPGGSWPNEPSGNTVLTNWPHSQTSGNGWSFFHSSGTVISDPSAQESPPNVLRYQLPVGETAGGGDAWYDIIPNRNELYVGFWHKLSSPFQGWTSLNNKVAFLWGPEGQGQFVWYLYAHNTGQQASGPFQFGVQLEMLDDNCHLQGFDEEATGQGDCPGSVNVFPNIDGSVYPQNSWNRIEIHVRASSGSQGNPNPDGLFEWWINGSLKGRFTTARLRGPFRQWQYTPAWDCVPSGSAPCLEGIPHSSPLIHWFDHTRISRP